MRVRLQISVALGFATLTILMLALAIGLFHQANRRIAVDTARRAMAQAHAASETALMGLIAPVGRVVSATAAYAAAFPEVARDARAFVPIDRQISALPQVYSLFLGHADTGDFRQVVRLDPGATEFGTARVPVPPGTARVWRSISGSEGSRTEQLSFVNLDGTILLALQQGADFDPRQREWYRNAIVSDHPVVSPIYTFASSGRPGMTLSERVTSRDGAVVAVAGGDMSLDSISLVLRAVRPDSVGEAFLMNTEGTLVSSSEGNDDRHNGPLTEAATAHWKATAEPFFRLRVPGSPDVHLVSVKPTQPMFGEQPMLAVIVPEAHFTAEIEATARRVLWLTGLVALAALAGTVALARLLSSSLASVADEARRISAFNLSGRFALKSRIVEVDDLGVAMANMKNSLTSFTAYVPKDVVRAIVASGNAVEVGGTAREVSMLFSDIEGFTQRSEHLPAETVTVELSRYFGAMEHAVTQHGGTIDKYIGDAVMAMWNAPSDDPDHAANACQAALTCRAAERMLTGVAGSTLFPTRTRFGLHCDRVVVGNVGSPERLQYTAIGGAVNLASRVEGLNKRYGTDILATGAIADRVGDRFVFRTVDHVAPAGTSRAVVLLELLGDAGPGARYPVPQALADEVAVWHAALALYRARDWQGAQAAFAALRPRSSRDPMVARYLDRCARHIATPPAADWDGVHIFDRK